MPTIDSTMSGPDANCYCTLEEADEFLDEIYGAEEWLSATEEDRQRLLISATKVIESLPVMYDSYDEDQALWFPIVNTDDPEYDGFAEAAEAVIWQALYMLKTHDEVEDGRVNSIQGVKSDSSGGVSTNYTGFNFMKKWSPKVLELLGDYIDFSITFQRYEV